MACSDWYIRLGHWAVLLLALLWFAPAAAKDTVTVGLQLEPPILDPGESADSSIGEVVYANLFEALTRASRDGVVRPWLATSWTISRDGLIYVFRLHPQVRFHNGHVLSAADVKFTLDRALAPGSVNPQKPWLQAVSSVDVIDPLALRIRLRTPDSGLLFALSLPAFVIVEPSSVASNKQHPVGTGPYRLDVWRRGEAIRLVRNDDYWGRPARLKHAVFRFIADSTAAYAAVTSGDVDVFPDFPAPESISQIRQDRRLKVTVGTTEGQVILAINNKKPPFDNLLVRRAIAYAIDRNAVINGAFYGLGAPIGSHYAPQDEGYVDLTGLYRHDPAKARALLAQAGYPNGFAATLKLPPPMYARRSGEIVAAQLAAVGIKLEIRNVEWAQWLAQVFQGHDYDLTVINHIEPMDYDIYGRDGYYFGYDSPTFKALLAELRATTDHDKRIALIQAIQRKIAGDAVNGFLFELPRLVVADARLSGFQGSAAVPSNDVSGAFFPDVAGAGGDTATAPSAKQSGLWNYAPLLLLLVFLVYAGGHVGPAYLVSRGGYLLVTLFVASSAVFFIISLLPGDPASFMAGLNATPETLQALHRQLGLDAPLASRYLRWLAGVFSGDLGVSYTYQVPVGRLIADRAAVSVPLALYAVVIAGVLAVPIGLFTAAWHGRKRGVALSVVTQIGIAIPDFWLAILFVLLFSMSLRWFSAGGFAGWDAGLWPALRSLTLPALALAIPQAAILARVLSRSLLDVLGADYIRTARAKGLTHAQTLWRHAFPNAIIPVITVLGLQFSFLLAGAIIIENVFALPGLGRLLSQAVEQRDLVVVQGVVVLLVAAVVFVSFVVDVAYAVADPRLRVGRRT
jgi:ABC-type dipeptide/oligopeptide/nickel transport system permease component/ABC-type transport system substrate-binding protein